LSDMKIERNSDADVALITLGNFLIDNYATLTTANATGCRCGSCTVWVVLDLDDKRIAEEETLTELVNSFPASGEVKT
jgi:hypothetical protein